MSDPANVAEMDQECASLRDRARLAGYFYRQLRAQGVPFVLAATLVKDWQWQSASTCCELD